MFGLTTTGRSSRQFSVQGDTTGSGRPGDCGIQAPALSVQETDETRTAGKPWKDFGLSGICPFGIGNHVMCQ
jgi:hypothetical protein